VPRSRRHARSSRLQPHGRAARRLEEGAGRREL